MTGSRAAQATTGWTATKGCKTTILDWSGEEGEDELKDVEQLIFDHPQSKGSVQGSSGANFPEFVWVGFDNKQENEEATFEPLGQIDWHMEIGEK
jgi:hypothetical protein